MARTIALLSVAAGAGMLYVALPQMRIDYHNWQVDRLSKQLTAATPAEQTDLYHYLSHHQGQLISLGYLFKTRYDMPELKGQYGGVIIVLNRDFIRANQAQTATLSFAHETGMLEICDIVENKAKWDAFVEEHNTPEFAAGVAAE